MARMVCVVLLVNPMSAVQGCFFAELCGVVIRLLSAISL